MDDETERWEQVGKLLGRHREKEHLTKREAGRRAGFSEGQWRDMESGKRSLGRGITVPVNPKDATLRAAAKAVGADVQEVFTAAGRKLDAEEPMRIDAQGAPLEEIKVEDPEYYSMLVGLAAAHMRARRERLGR